MLNSGLYGTLQGSILWYRLLASKLISFGFKINPYDLCIVNAIMDGKQCSVVFHVDNNKISNVDSKMVLKVIGIMEDEFGKIVMTRGKIHDFLGMKLEFLGDKRVKVDMRQYLLKAIEEFGEELSPVTTLAKNNLMNVDPDSPKVTEEKQIKFHSIVMLLMYVALRGRRDLQPSLSVLLTRVQSATEDDYYKLR